MLSGYYEFPLVLVSILVAMFASYTALDLAGRIKRSHGKSAARWVVAGAFALGSGIWAMHFIGMLAFRLPLPVGYDVGLTFVSWLLPVVVCGLALWPLHAPQVSAPQLLWGAVLMGIGINTMHYTGMAAMRMSPGIVYDPLLFAASIVIAISASGGALWIAFRLSHSLRHGVVARLGAAAVLGIAIAGMHYTGMAAAEFQIGSVCRAAGTGMSQDALALLVAVAIVAVLTIALLASIFAARLDARAQSLAASQEISAARQALYLREQQARVEAEQLSQLKDEFLATLSHELRTPLNAMLGWSQLLLQGAKDEAMLRRGLETIERNARAQSQLIDDLLDMSRLITGKVRLDVKPVWPAEFTSAAVETARPAALAKRVRLHAELDPDAGPVLCDPSRMQQVMSNLVSNAVKFTDAQGEVNVRLDREGEQVVIRVADTGVGIDPAFLPHVFERFRQGDASVSRRHGGLGLGLAIARQLVELQGGTISAHSDGPGRGAQFTVTMPLQPIEAGPAAGAGLDPGMHEAALQAPSLRGASVLVVDDEPDSLELVLHVLAATGATLLAATSAAEALELVRRERPVLLISDIGMPGTDGFELMRQVRASDQRQPALGAIALTAFSRAEDRVRAFDAGFDAFLAKPVQPAELLRTVRQMLERRRPYAQSEGAIK
jgi:signal transduction histidine kinase/ActR/RegA family two-component response regulator